MANSRSGPLALLVLLLLLLSGCSGDGDDGGDVDSGADAEPSASGSGTAGSSPEATPTPEETGPGIGAGTAGTPGPTVAPQPGSGVDLGAPPETYDDAVAHVEAALAVADTSLELSRFTTPTGNIYCVVDDPTLAPACELGEGAVRRVDVCGVDAPSVFVGRVELVDGRPVAVCNTDTIRAGDAPVLGYGGVAVWEGSPVRCVAEEIGVTCLDSDSRTGFFLARGRFLLLG